MMSESMYSQPSFDPPAPVMGGMRWARPLRGPDPFWEMVANRRQTSPKPGCDTREHPAPVKKEPAAAPSPPVEAAPPYPFFITTTPPLEARIGETYTYHPRAFDANTNGFIWYCETNVPGLTVDRYTGAITWTPTAGGWFEITLCAGNVYGKTTRQTWKLCVRKAAVTHTPVAHPRFTAALRQRRAAPPRPPLPFPTPWRAEQKRSPPAIPRVASPPPPPPCVALLLRI